MSGVKKMEIQITGTPKEVEEMFRRIGKSKEPVDLTINNINPIKALKVAESIEDITYSFANDNVVNTENISPESITIIAECQMSPVMKLRSSREVV